MYDMMANVGLYKNSRVLYLMNAYKPRLNLKYYGKNPRRNFEYEKF